MKLLKAIFLITLLVSLGAVEAKESILPKAALEDETLTLNLFPDVPSSATNKYWINMAFKGVRIGTPIPKHIFARETDEILPAVYTYLHPQSPRRGDKQVLGRVLDLLDAMYNSYENGEYKYGEMLFCSQMAQAYYMLKIYSPQDISPEREVFWNKVLTKQSQTVLEKTDLYNDLKLTSVWLNGDIRLALGLYFSGLILDKPEWSRKAENVMENLFPQTTLNGGGTHYVSYQNESPTYHGESKQFVYRWWYLTGSKKAKSFLQKMTPYAPITVHPIGKGFVEYSSSPSWKPYYNQIIPEYPAAISALLFGDAYNWSIGKVCNTWDLAFIYRENIEAKPLPDNYVVYDKNIVGPRGRFGRWGYVGCGRNVQSAAPESSATDRAEMDGKMTIAGAYLLDNDTPANKYPINAAFHGAMPAVKTSLGKETDFNRGRVTTHLISSEHNSMILSQEVCSMTSQYTLSKNRFVQVNWTGIQEWIFTPRRVIGMLAVESTSDNNVAYGLFNRIKLVSGRLPNTGNRKTLNQIDNNNFAYGDLKVRYHQENYNGRRSSFYCGTTNDTKDNYSCILQLHDQNDIEDDNKLIYDKGYRKFVIVEVIPADEVFSSNVRMYPTNDSDLCGFSMSEKENTITIIHNVSNQSKHFNAIFHVEKGCKLFLSKSWEEGLVTKLNVAKKCGGIEVEIPSNQHILVVSATTYNPKYNTYKDIFK